MADLSDLAAAETPATERAADRERALEAGDGVALLYDIAASLAGIRQTRDAAVPTPVAWTFDVDVDAGEDIFGDNVDVERDGNSLRAVVVLDTSAVFQMRHYPDPDAPPFTSDFNDGNTIGAGEAFEFDETVAKERVNYRVDTDGVTVRKLLVLEFNGG